MWWRLARWPLFGALGGATIGGVLALVSVLAGGGTVAGMLLLAAVASFPAGVWVINVSADAMQRGSPDLIYAAMIAAPAVNFAVIATLVGVAVVLLDRVRKS